MSNLNRNLTVTSLPNDKYFKIYTKLTHELKRKIDLIYFDIENDDFSKMLVRTGEIKEFD